MTSFEISFIIAEFIIFVVVIFVVEWRYPSTPARVLSVISFIFAGGALRMYIPDPPLSITDVLFFRPGAGWAWRIFAISAGALLGWLLTVLVQRFRH